MNDTLLSLLRSVDTPTVCNAIEVAQGQRGFRVRCPVVEGLVELELTRISVGDRGLIKRKVNHKILTICGG